MYLYLNYNAFLKEMHVRTYKIYSIFKVQYNQKIKLIYGWAPGSASLKT